MTDQARRSLHRFPRPVGFDARSGTIRIGVVVPSDFGLDWQYWGYLPEEVSLYFTRTPHVGKPVGVGLAKDLGRPAGVWKATRSLSSVQPAATLYACSSGSFVRGLEGERALRECMLDAGAGIAVTSSGAMLEALTAVNARRVAIATPYNERLTALLVDFLEAAGFEVTSAVYLGLTENIESVDQATIADLVREAGTNADATFVSCTALRTHGIIAALERDLGHPVFTSNQVSLWAVLKAVGALHHDVGAVEPDQIIGGASPMAQSTALLLDAAAAEQAGAA